MWRLGAALQSEGKSDEALDAYYKSYTSGQPEISKRIIIEVLYQKINGTLDGLDDKIGVRPESNIAVLPVQNETVAQVTETPAVETSPTPAPEIREPEVSPTPEIEITKPEIKPTPQKEETPLQVAETSLTNRAAETPAKVEETPKTEVKVETTPNPTPEVSPTPEVQAEVKESPTPEPLPTPAIKPETTPEETIMESTPEIKPETKTEKKPIQPLENQVAEVKLKQPQNSGFDAIIITVPKTELLKKPAKAEDKPNSSAENSADKTASNDNAEFIIGKNLSKSRPRIVAEEKAEDIQPCRIVTSQDNVSILNDGGSLGILVGFENGGDVRKIKSESSNPADIEITFEPEIGALSGRAFFIVKSVSSNRGLFTAVFEAPCGRKEISVKVR